ncbi:MAG: hypothetical protein IT202_00010 [Fimbriimonadaceae bacterium]|nr:hypothetical protein [Fimbriimonadaceae bacterium]MCC6350880.1 hypothetical protein [Fimbriimonadaceae bacterium]
MVAALAGLLLLSGLGGQDPAAMQQEFPGPEGGPNRLMVITSFERMDPPKTSPKHGWVFEWAVGALGRQDPALPFNARFRVFSQLRRQENDVAPKIGRMLLRMWDMNIRKLKTDHASMYNGGIIDFYLCFGGRPGGEQLFDEDEERGVRKKVNTVYIYGIQTFTKPPEQAREVAHEYGHATLPPVGGFETPEDWGNGYLGEKLYLKWFHDEVAASRLRPDDVMGTTVEELARYVKSEVDPFMTKAATTEPAKSSIGGKGPASMDAYVGLVLYAEAIFPPDRFARSLRLIGSTFAGDYPKAMVAASEEIETYVLRVPPQVKGRQIWIPLGKGKISGTVGIVRRSGDWALIEGDAESIVIRNPAQPPLR